MAASSRILVVLMAALNAVHTSIIQDVFWVKFENRELGDSNTFIKTFRVPDWVSRILFVIKNRFFFVPRPPASKMRSLLTFSLSHQTPE